MSKINYIHLQSRSFIYKLTLRFLLNNQKIWKGGVIGIHASHGPDGLKIPDGPLSPLYLLTYWARLLVCQCWWADWNMTSYIMNFKCIHTCICLYMHKICLEAYPSRNTDCLWEGNRVRGSEGGVTFTVSSFQPF